jgi:hypothetical protein
VKIVSNIAGITGGVRLWDGRMDHAFAEQLPAFDEVFPDSRRKRLLKLSANPPRPRQE